MLSVLSVFFFIGGFLRHIICIQILLLTCLFVRDAYAQTVQALNFGSVVVIDNSAQYDITVNTDGSYSHGAGFIEITPPQEGIYDIGNILPAGTAVTSVTVTQDAPLSAGVYNFQVVNLTETHTNPSDGSGVVRVWVGGTARSSGTTAPYPDNVYTGTITIQVNF